MISCIIMASGFSNRLGRNKLMLRYEEKTLIEHTVEKALTLEVDEILLMYRERKVYEVLKKYKGIRMMHNSNAEKGQSEAIKIGIKNAKENTKGYMFLVGDQPFLTVKTMRKLIDIFREDASKIVLPISDGKKGSPVVFPVEFKDEFLKLEGDSGGRAIIEKNRNRVKTLKVDRKELYDIDIEEDLKLLKNEKHGGSIYE